MDWQSNQKPTKLPPRGRHAHPFHHIVPPVRPSIWHFKNSSPLLWNPRHFEKGALPQHLASTFSFVMPFSHELEHTKLMTSLSSTYPWQFSTGNLFYGKDCTNSKMTKILRAAGISLCALLCLFHPPDSFAKHPPRFFVCDVGILEQAATNILMRFRI